MPSSDVTLSLDAFMRAQSVTNAFGGRAAHGPAGEVQRSPRPPSRNPVSGPTSKGKGWMGMPKKWPSRELGICHSTHASDVVSK